MHGWCSAVLQDEMACAWLMVGWLGCLLACLLLHRLETRYVLLACFFLLGTIIALSVPSASLILCMSKYKY